LIRNGSLTLIHAFLGPIALGVFLDNFFIVAKSGNYPQEDLAKFGYKLNIKVNSLKPLSIFFPALFEPCVENS